MDIEKQLALEQTDKAIIECYAMIDHFIVLKNKAEIAYWRRVLQNEKMYQRRLKNS